MFGQCLLVDAQNSFGGKLHHNGDAESEIFEPGPRLHRLIVDESSLRHTELLAHGMRISSKLCHQAHGCIILIF